MAKKRLKRALQKQGIQKRLAAYSVTAGAVMALGSSATLINPETGEAKVMYTDVNPGDGTLDANSTSSSPFTGTFGTGTGAVTFKIIHAQIGPTSTGTASALIDMGGGTISATGGFAKTFPSSVSISAVTGAPNVQICTSLAPAVTGRFIGVSFLISGQPHYGWIRIDVAADCDSVTIVDYAYEDTPNTPIHAGAPAPVGGIVHDISDTHDTSQK